MQIQEIKKLDAYLKKTFGNTRIRIVPKEEDTANVFIGEERIGHLSVDDEDDERSYILEMKMTFGEPVGVKSIKTLEAFLRRKFDNERIQVTARPRKTDSAEVNIGEEHIGVLFFDDRETRSCFFEMAILELDLEDAAGSA